MVVPLRSQFSFNVLHRCPYVGFCSLTRQNVAPISLSAVSRQCSTMRTQSKGPMAMLRNVLTVSQVAVSNGNIAYGQAMYSPVNGGGLVLASPSSFASIQPPHFDRPFIS